MPDNRGWWERIISPEAPKSQAPPRELYDIDDPKSPLYKQRHGGRVVTGLVDSAVSGFTLPGQVYRGEVDLNDPAVQDRAADTAGLGMTGGFAGSGRGGTTIASGFQTPKATAQDVQHLGDLYRGAKPAIVRGEAEAATEAIYKHAEQQRSPQYPNAQEPVFKDLDRARELTEERMPQVSVRDQLPRPDPGEKLPMRERAAPIREHSDEIGRAIAADLKPAVEANAKPGQFYYTGPVLKGLEDKAGLSPDESRSFMRDWSGQGAATSPRTATPQNLRNASYLQFLRAEGTPLTSALRESQGNRPGFAMMGMHTDLADQFARGVVDPNRNPKPFTFRENWAGNLSDVTADTHNIRSTLLKLDELYRGKLPKEWFTDEAAFKAYKDRGGFDEGLLPVGSIKDTLGGAPKGGVKRQTEYGVMAEPYYKAAEELGISPAAAQAYGWFHYGPRTGLRSPDLNIPELLNNQIEATAKATGLHPEKILQLWSRRRIPLAANESSSSSQVG